MTRRGLSGCSCRASSKSLADSSNFPRDLQEKLRPLTEPKQSLQNSKIGSLEGESAAEARVGETRARVENGGEVKDSVGVAAKPRGRSEGEGEGEGDGEGEGEGEVAGIAHLQRLCALVDELHAAGP